jgi:hypothetical protein
MDRFFVKTHLFTKQSRIRENLAYGTSGSSDQFVKITDQAPGPTLIS